MQLGVDIKEEGKLENPEKNPRSTAEINYDNSIHMSPKFWDSAQRLYPDVHPSSYWPRPTGLNLELSGERERANRVRHPCSHILYT